MMSFLMIGDNDDWPTIPDETEMPMMEEPKPGQAPQPLPKFFKNMFKEVSALTPSTKGIIANSVEELEEEIMPVMRSLPRLAGIPVLSVGPLMSVETFRPSEQAKMQAISSWLDRQAPASVAYVSFGM